MASNYIPLVDLRAQYQSIQKEVDQAVLSVLSSGQYILGPEVAAFESELAAYCGVSHAVAVASGTDALELTLRAYGIGPGDEVIVPAWTFIATAIAVSLTGATPVFVDVEPTTATLDPDRVSRALSPRTRAIIPVHLYGHPCRIETLRALADKAKLPVIEDCAQAIGAKVGNQQVGSFGHAGALSFYPSKNLGGYGDGGAVVTNDAALAKQLQGLRWYGAPDRATAKQLGRNSRLDELQAALLRVKLRHLDAWTQTRQQHARMYQTLFQQTCLDGLRLPQTLPDHTHVYHLYPIRVNDRNALLEALRAQGIGAQIHYDRILPDQPLFKSTSQQQAFPQARAWAETVLSLPLYPELTSVQIEQVVQTVIRTAKQSPSPSRKR
jgi:dTDP-4-amino-4,6-dideoxygalactose transaminase